MRYMVVSNQVPNLTQEQNQRLYAAMGVFYNDIPADVTLEGDFIREDRLGSYSVLTVPDRATLDRILAPFDGLVQVEIVPLLPPRAQG
ncbi:hypothetical protein KKF91_21210 [Myxococcota bacterium]|nr:hypothetical protein [Myxococcota bacterium]MBU1433064.1 hypothetical protein [Myxococcota bacterium]MBU1898201.1 hypothetical protein [Myxococcota bacterium]